MTIKPPTDDQKRVLRLIQERGLTDLRSFLSYNWRWGKGDWEDGEAVEEEDRRIIFSMFLDDIRRAFYGGRTMEARYETSDYLVKIHVERDDYTEEFGGLEYRVELKPGVAELLTQDEPLVGRGGEG